MDVGFAVARIAAARDHCPEAMHFLVGADAAPGAYRVVAFIFQFVVDDWFLVGVAPFRRFFHGR